MPTTTAFQTVRVALYGPNLMHLTDGETFHVHAQGCADCQKYDRAGYEAENMEVSYLMQIVLATYPPSEFEWDPHDPDNKALYEADFKVFPCVKFPVATWPDAAPAPAPALTEEEREVAEARQKADESTALYEQLEKELAAVSDEDFKYDRDKIRTRADAAFRSAVGWCTNLARLTSPRAAEGSLSTPARKKRAPSAEARPGAASKEGEMVCTGLPKLAESTGCGKTKAVTDFPTTGMGDRAPECRQCRNARRDAKKVAA